MEETERTTRPSHIPDRKWDACIQKSSVIVGACTLAGTVISSLFGNTAGAMYGASLGAAWSWSKCRALYREDDASGERADDIFRRLEPREKFLEDSSKCALDDGTAIGDGAENEKEEEEDEEDDDDVEGGDDADQEDGDEELEVEENMNCGEDDLDSLEYKEEEEEEQRETQNEYKSQGDRVSDKEAEKEEFAPEECFEVEVEMCGEDNENSFGDETCNQVMVMGADDLCEDEEGETLRGNTYEKYLDETAEPEACSHKNDDAQGTTDGNAKGIWWISQTEDSSSSDDVCTCIESTESAQKESEFKLSPVSSIIPKPFKDSSKGDTTSEDVCTCDECTCEQ